VPPSGVGHAALWIPLGYAATRFIGDDTPLLAMVTLTATLAGLHRVIPGIVELVAGGGGLMMSVFAAADGRGCGEVLGDGGTAAILVFGSLMSLSGFVRLLGSANGREMARHLVVATAALQLGLFALSPVGQATVNTQDRFTPPAVLLGVMLVATLIGIRSRLGLPGPRVGSEVSPVLGVGLVLALGVLAVTGGACAGSAGTHLAGTLTFAAVAVFLADRDDESSLDPSWPDDRSYDAA
jgi:hypothetical protein